MSYSLSFDVFVWETIFFNGQSEILSSKPKGASFRTGLHFHPEPNLPHVKLEGIPTCDPCQSNCALVYLWSAGAWHKLGTWQEHHAFMALAFFSKHIWAIAKALIWVSHSLRFQNTLQFLDTIALSSYFAGLAGAFRILRMAKKMLRYIAT